MNSTETIAASEKSEPAKRRCTPRRPSNALAKSQEEDQENQAGEINFDLGRALKTT